MYREFHQPGGVSFDSGISLSSHDVKKLLFVVSTAIKNGPRNYGLTRGLEKQTKIALHAQNDKGNKKKFVKTGEKSVCVCAINFIETQIHPECNHL